MFKILTICYSFLKFEEETHETINQNNMWFRFILMVQTPEVAEGYIRLTNFFLQIKQT